jgi:hypothetical protein
MGQRVLRTVCRLIVSIPHTDMPQREAAAAGWKSPAHVENFDDDTAALSSSTVLSQRLL